MKPLKEKISITIDNDILAQLRYLAEADDRSLSQYINLILRDYIRTNGKNSDENNELQGEWYIAVVVWRYGPQVFQPPSKPKTLI